MYTQLNFRLKISTTSKNNAFKFHLLLPKHPVEDFGEISIVFFVKITYTMCSYDYAITALYNGKSWQIFMTFLHVKKINC